MKTKTTTVRGDSKTTKSNRLFTLLPWRRVSCSLFFAAAAIAVFAVIGSSRAIGQGGPPSPTAAAKKIAPWVVEHTANGQQAEFFVLLADQPDFSAAATMRTKTEKGRYVYNALRNKSQTTQGPILRWLREHRLEHRSFYIVNAILVKGTREIAETLAARPDVARVEGNLRIKNSLPQPGSVTEAPSQPEAPERIEPGINYTHAPLVWELGFTGQGIVVASADTGVRWTHNALKPHYRGWDGVNADHDYNWHDSIHDSGGPVCGNDSPFPCDGNSHGSHTTGTMIGDDGAGNQIGMAPGAKWIACRMLDEEGNGTDANAIECMEFFLAPYPVGGDPGQGDPTKAPDITNNSWGCYPAEDCGDALLAAVEAQRAAGIMMVVAAHNQGPDCSTVATPGIYEASYTVGALSTGTDDIAPFSGRGPVTSDGSGRIKPDITAPGAGVRSATNASDNSYSAFWGTSMATPHIAGAMALLWSAHPELQNEINSSRAVLNNAAIHIASTECGDAGPPNNVYGWGRVDILAAVTGITPTPTPTPTPPCGRPAWLQRAPVPYSAAGNFAASDGTFVYSGGGADSSFTIHNDLLRYNPATDAWTSLAPSPDYYFAAPAVYFNGKIYIFGGHDQTIQPTNTTRIYNIGTNTWSNGAQMPAALGIMAAALWDGIVYVAGGSPDLGFSVVNTLYAYNIASNTWSTLEPMPQGTCVSGFGAIHGKVYVAGGSDGHTQLDTLYVYDIATNTWTTGANMPVAAEAPGSAVLDNKLYVFGGVSPLITTQIYNPGRNTWSFGPNMSVYRWRFYGTAVGNHSIVALGGGNAAGDTIDANEELTTSPCGPRPHPTPRSHPTPRH
jgi:subtilisin family serine protease